MFRHHLPPSSRGSSTGAELVCRVDYRESAGMTEGYSGSDIRLVCKEAAMRTVRKVFDILEAGALKTEYVLVCVLVCVLV